MHVLKHLYQYVLNSHYFHSTSFNREGSLIQLVVGGYIKRWDDHSPYKGDDHPQHTEKLGRQVRRKSSISCCGAVQMCTSVTRFWKREVYSKLAKKSKGILRKLTKKFRLRTYLKNVQKKMVAYQKHTKHTYRTRMKSRGGSGLRKRFCFFLYSYVALVSPKKARFILGSFASETDKSHLLEGGGCFFFSSHPWYLFFFFCDSLNSLESTLEIEPLQQNSPLDRICRGKLGMLRQAVDALPKRSQRRLGGMVIG